MVSDFGSNMVCHQLDIDNNLNQVGQFTFGGNNVTSLSYDPVDAHIWAIQYIASTQNSRIIRTDTSGVIQKQYEFKNLIPIADRYKSDWTNVLGFNITLSPDKTTVLAMFSFSKRVYKVNAATGAYQGYFDLSFVTDPQKIQVGGIATDGVNLWLGTYNLDAPGSMIFVRSSLTGSTIDTFTVTNSNPLLTDIWYCTDIEYDEVGISGKSVLWFRNLSQTLQTQNLIALELAAAPCQEPPVINAVDQVILLNSTFNPMTGVSAFDCNGNDITNLVMITQYTVDTSQIGSYLVTYQVTSSNGKQTTKTISVKVIDQDCQEPPVINAADKVIALGSVFDPMAGVTAMNCNGDDLTSQIIVVNNTVDTSLPGNYSVTYEVTGSNGKTTVKTITVVVADEECQDSPIIYAGNRTIPLDSIFDPMEDVTAFDCSGHNITALVVVTQNTVDTSQEGTYYVTYEVTASNGKTTIKTITVIVALNPFPSRDQAVADLIESVALQEASMAHILNAEGRKLQKAVAYEDISLEELMRINKSVKSMVSSVAKHEAVLTEKLQQLECYLCE